MGKINPKIHIGLGILVIISSLLQERLKFFLIFGIGFLIWGGIGLLIGLNKTKQAKSNLQDNNTHPVQTQIRQHFHNQQAQQQQNQSPQHRQRQQHQQHTNNSNHNNQQVQHSRQTSQVQHSQTHNSHAQHAQGQHHAHNQHANQHTQQAQPTRETHKRCPSCHKIIEKQYRFCPHCGYGV